MVFYLAPIVRGRRGFERLLLLLPAALCLAGGKLYSPMLFALFYGAAVTVLTARQGIEARERHLNSALTASLVAVLFFVGDRDALPWTPSHMFLVAAALLSYVGAVGVHTWGWEWYLYMGRDIIAGGALSVVYPPFIEYMAKVCAWPQDAPLVSQPGKPLR